MILYVIVFVETTIYTIASKKELSFYEDSFFFYVRRTEDLFLQTHIYVIERNNVMWVVPTS